MYILLFLLALFSWFSCGSNTPLVTSKDPIYVEDKLQQFVNRFDQYAAILGVKPDYSMLSVYSTDEDPDSTHLAVTIIGTNGTKEIIVYNRFFDTATDVAREIVLFHELGHATLHRDHKSGSIMNVTQLPEDYYLFYYDYLIEELFHKNPTEITFAYIPY